MGLDFTNQAVNTRFKRYNRIGGQTPLFESKLTFASSRAIPKKQKGRAPPGTVRSSAPSPALFVVQSYDCGSVFASEYRLNDNFRCARGHAPGGRAFSK